MPIDLLVVGVSVVLGGGGILGYDIYRFPEEWRARYERFSRWFDSVGQNEYSVELTRINREREAREKKREAGLDSTISQTLQGAQHLNQSTQTTLQSIDITVETLKQQTSDVGSEILSLEQAKDALKRATEEHEDIIRKMQIECERAIEGVKEMHKELVLSKEKQLQDACQKLESATKEIEFLKEELTALSQKATTPESQKLQYQEGLKKFKAQVDTYKAENARLLDKLEEHSKLIKELTQRLEERQRSDQSVERTSNTTSGRFFSVSQ